MHWESYCPKLGSQRCLALLPFPSLDFSPPQSPHTLSLLKTPSAASNPAQMYTFLANISVNICRENGSYQSTLLASYPQHNKTYPPLSCPPSSCYNDGVGNSLLLGQSRLWSPSLHKGRGGGYLPSRGLASTLRSAYLKSILHLHHTGSPCAKSTIPPKTLLPTLFIKPHSSDFAPVSRALLPLFCVLKAPPTQTLNVELEVSVPGALRSFSLGHVTLPLLSATITPLCLLLSDLCLQPRSPVCSRLTSSSPFPLLIPSAPSLAKP